MVIIKIKLRKENNVEKHAKLVWISVIMWYNICGTSLKKAF